MPDVIDAAAGLAPGDPVHTARRFRAKVVEATQASHDAILLQPVPGLSVADRLRVAVFACKAAAAPALAQHYRNLLEALPDAQPPAPRNLAALQHFAATLIPDPRRGDRAALTALKSAGLDDAAIVALAQLVAFLAYQTRVVAGLQALLLSAPGPAEAGDPPRGSGNVAKPHPLESRGDASMTTPPVIRRKGFSNQTLGWLSWLNPVDLAQASPLQQAVLDESHAQARTSAYYLTLVHQPLMLRHRSEAYNSIMYAPGGLPRAERELGAMVVSVSNGCVYCTSVHAQRFAQLAKRHDTVEQVFDDPSTAGTTDRERAIARFAQAVTLRPQALGTEDIELLRGAGLDDVEIIDLLHAVAIFGWANRLMQNLGEPAAVK